MNRTFQWMLGGLLGAGLMFAAASHAEDKAEPKTVVAHVHGAGDNKDKIKGELTFTDVDGGVKVSGEVSGLTPGKHGMHIHEKGDLSDPALKSAGGHFNPEHHKHGGPDSESHHAGDWGNLMADEKGVAKVEGTFKGVSLEGKENGILGRSVIIHAKEDDLKTDPAGAAGDRIAGGKIEASN